jgi:hypothetical protein
VALFDAGVGRIAEAQVIDPQPVSNIMNADPMELHSLTSGSWITPTSINSTAEKPRRLAD